MKIEGIKIFNNLNFSRERSTRALLGEPGFHMEPIAFLAGHPNALEATTGKAAKHSPVVFSFRKCEFLL